MRTRMRMVLVIVLLGSLAGCSFKILRTVDDTESTWRPVDGQPASAAPAPAPPPMEHGY